MLQIKNLTKYYGKIRGVKELTLTVDKGEIFGFIGPNGAGKSTTIRCIMNLLNINSGEIYVDNILCDKKDDYKLKNIIGYLPSEIHLYDDLTVKQMIEYNNSFYSKDCTQRANYLVNKLSLDITKKIEDLSFGNLKKLGIILAMMHEPKLLILDEATSGLDPLMQEQFYNLLLEEKKKGTTIFFSSHNLNEVKRICDRVGIIKEGSLVEIGAINELLSNNVQTITIESKDVEKIIKDCHLLITSQNENTIKFMYQHDINVLIQKLGKYKIKKILIEEPSIEEIFMHFYE